MCLGAYTGMRTVRRDSIVEFNTHMNRITSSVSQLFSGDKKVELSMTSFRDIKQFEAKVLPLLKKGLESYYDTVDKTTHSSNPFEAKVSILVTYSHEVTSNSKFLFIIPKCLRRKKHHYLQHIFRNSHLFLLIKESR